MLLSRIHAIQNQITVVLFNKILLFLSPNSETLKKLVKLTFTVSLLLGLQACNLYYSASKTNISDTYKLAEQKVNPKFSFFHNKKDSTFIYLKLPRKQLKYDDNLTAQIKLKWVITPDYESNKIVDSSSAVVYDTLDGTQGNYLEHKQPVKLASGNDYVIKTIFADITQEVKKESYHTVKKENAYQRNFFEVLQKGNHKYEPLIRPEDTIRLHYKYSGKLTVQYFDKNFQPPRPPYLNARNIDNNYTPDSTFRINLENNQSNLLHLPAKGIYHIQADTSQASGLTLFNFGENYPLINQPENMVGPARYIATKKEYNKLKNADTIKTAVDKFWINKSGNSERARIQIRNYYSRVEKANKLFYTQKPGWKTDRGMIYIILGAPKVVYRSNKIETWIYGESARYNALKLKFKKTENPFTSEDYKLKRSPKYKDQWFYAIDIWRR